MPPIDPNRAALERIALALDDLRDEVVFVGGATVGLLITDPAAPPVRVTKDIDCIIEVASRVMYDHQIGSRLRQLGFQEMVGEDIPICAWQYKGIRLNVMPTAPDVLGFSNRWYAATMATATPVLLSRCTIYVASGPCFLATKLEAFAGRGNSDYYASHDLEDVVAVLDGRPSLVHEVAQANKALRIYLCAQMQSLLANAQFRNALPGHLAESSREAYVLSQMEAIVAL